MTVSRESGRTAYVLKDPISLSYFELTPMEYHVATLLNGDVSQQDILEQLAQRFPDANVSEQELKTFLGTLVGSQLVVSTVPGYGKMLAKRAERQAASFLRRLSAWNVLTLRWKGVDPHRCLMVIDRWMGWIYSRTFAIAAVLLMLAALLTFAIRLTSGRLPSFELQAILTVQNIPILVASIIVIKILHEIGHGLTCVHYGGECHELGILFIVFFPLLYCDTTDSWQHHSRWQRARVAGAGIFVELLIASVCCLLWSLSVPGLVSLMLFNIMVVCSLNTVLVNGNPLLRYDGYYVLSDVLNYPNLGPESRSLALSWFERLLFGPSGIEQEAVSLKRVPLALFGAASSAYRIFVMAMILWGVHQLLKQYNLHSLTVCIAFPMIAGLVLSIAFAVIKRGQTFVQHATGTKRVRAVIGVSGFLLGLGALFLIPLPHSIVVPFTLEPGACRPVYVSVPGRIVDSITPLSRVQQGELIATFTNPEVEFAVEQTRADLAGRELHLENLRKYRSFSQLASSSIPAAASSLEIVRERSLAEQQRLERLQIRSPINGQFFSPRNTPRESFRDDQVLQWSGLPFERKNRHAWLAAQTLLGWIGETEDFEAVMYVPQYEMEFVRPHAVTELHFQSDSAHPCQASVIEIGTEAVQTAPRELFHNRLLAPDPLQGQFHPSETLYRVRAEIRSGIQAPLYSTGLARIHCQPISLLHRLWRAISHAFALEV